MKSTVLPRTTEDIVLPILEKYSRKKAGKDFGLGMNPEFLREGIAINDFLNPDRIVIGYYDNKSRDYLKKLYDVFSCPKVETSLSAAEMIKYTSNSFLSTKISFANEIGNICKKLGIDTYEVFKGVGLDNRINPSFFNSGIGFGGSCFPKDLYALIAKAEEIEQEPRLLRAVMEVNENQPKKMLDLMEKYMLLDGKNIGVLGLAFKPDTDDIRGSRAIPIIESLLEKGANVIAYDPKAMDNFKELFPQIKYAKSAEEVLNSDAVFTTVEWKEFNNLDFTGKIVIDGRRIEEAEKKADIYEGVCW